VQSENERLDAERVRKAKEQAEKNWLLRNPSELEKRAAEIVPKINAAVAEAEKVQDDFRKEEAWREIEERLRAKGIKI
jgi:hypothetical protein